MNRFYNKFTGEVLSTYPTPFASLPGARQKNNNPKPSRVEKFKKQHSCPYCGSERQFIEGTNVMLCPNENCNGKKRKLNDGTEVYAPEFDRSFELLETVGESIANELLV